jgi:acetamidase/formamidase
VTYDWLQPEGEAAFSLMEDGIGRRELLRAGTLLGTGAVTPSWLTSPGVAAAAAAPGGEPPVLQSGSGKLEGRYLRSTPETVHWGTLPAADSVPAATVDSGAVVTIDTVSHEGILADQGRDPDAYFGAHGIGREKVLSDARALAASALEPDDPYVVTGPVAVRGAQPGDVLQIDVIGMIPRVPYGVLSDRHAGGRSRDISTFTPVRRADGGYRALLPVSRQLRAEFPLDPYMGIMGVAGDELTFAEGLGVGSTLYLPVHVPGAKFFIGDPHYARDGKTALEAPLRATFRLSVLPRGSKQARFGQAADYWLPRTRLDETMRRALLESLEFLGAELGMPRALAYAHLSAATDYSRRLL